MKEVAEKHRTCDCEFGANGNNLGHLLICFHRCVVARWRGLGFLNAGFEGDLRCVMDDHAGEPTDHDSHSPSPRASYLILSCTSHMQPLGEHKEDRTREDGTTGKRKNHWEVRFLHRLHEYGDKRDHEAPRQCCYQGSQNGDTQAAILAGADVSGATCCILFFFLFMINVRLLMKCFHVITMFILQEMEAILKFPRQVLCEEDNWARGGHL
mmetsp:Transcript_28743/g.72183  ORF Transcript_28743/g.72183 Transcript_28743/m.72183 type:complete len:211 (+) Transcript_28743:785-1417(+)